MIAIFLSITKAGVGDSGSLIALGVVAIVATLVAYVTLTRNLAKHQAILQRLLREHNAHSQQPASPPEYASLADFTDALSHALDEYQQTLRELRTSEARWQAALRANGEGIWEWDVPNHRVYFSARWKELLGYSPEELPDTWETWERNVHPDDLVLARQGVEAMMHERNEEYRSEFRMRHKDGTYRWILARAVCVRDSNGKPVRVIGSHADVTEQRTTAAFLERVLSIFDHSQSLAQVGGWELDMETGALFWTDEVYRIYGLPVAKETPGVEVALSHYPGEAAEEIKEAIRKGVEEGKGWDLTTRFKKANGQDAWVRSIGVPVYQDGKVRLLRGAFQEVTRQKTAAEELEASELLLRAVFDAGRDGILVVDRFGMVQRANAPAQALFGVPAHGPSKRLSDLIPGVDLETEIGSGEALELDVRCADGLTRPLEIVLWPIGTPDESTVAAHIRDQSERRASQSIIFDLAHMDLLTRLPNRRLYRTRLEEALQPKPRKSSFAAILHLDLDNFKIVNDSLGHDAGDDVLLEAARRIRKAAGDKALVARLGGDEFAILVPRTRNDQALREIAERVIAALSSAFVLGRQSVFATASVGIAKADTPGIDPERLMRSADLAMHHVKSSGKAGFAFYAPEMGEAASQRMGMEANLRQALARGELSLVYQPIILLATGQVAGAEALLRWHNPTLGQVSPSVFIPMAEELGLIQSIGQWVASEATRQVGQWVQEALVPDTFEISVNVSGKQLGQPDFVSTVREMVQRNGLRPRNLKLEITETVAMADMESSLGRLDELRRAGIRIAIDDFGTGYSSMAMLGKLPADTVKIDRSFVDRLGQDVHRTAVVHAIVALCQELGKSTTAEGIENPEQLDKLRGIACEHGQGYLFAKPLPADQFLEWFQNREPNRRQAA